MNKQDEKALIISLLAVGIILVIIAVVILNSNNQEKETVNNPVINPLISQKDASLLNLAINRTYKTKQTYWRVTDEFDNPQPFLDLYKIQSDHASAFQAVFKQFHLDVPKDSTYKSSESFSTLEKACAGMKILEQDNVRLYGELVNQIENQQAKDFINILIDRSNRDLDELRVCPQ